jgi:hypothetical protein
MDKSYLLIVIIILVILINNYQVENFNLDKINIFDDIASFSKEKYLILKKKFNDLISDKKEIKKEKKENSDCQDIKYDNYKINSTNVLSAYYGKSYYNFNDI